MVKLAAAAAALLPLVAAWPTAMQVDELIKRAGSTGRLNTGVGHPDPTFSEDQLVDVSAGSGHEFQAPSSTDLRGQCPGLNAAANHGFLPRNGKPTILTTISGLGDAYNMSPDLAAVLAAISILLSGDIPTMTWSIGGSFPASLPILSTPYGLLGTHNEYEGDASVARGDAYLNGGNVDVFQMRAWNKLYARVGKNLTLDKAAAHSNYVTQYSVSHNPYYFSGPFSGIVATAAHNFVVNFMSNHSAKIPGGYLDDSVLKSFFAITGNAPGNFVHHKYQERIPDNWYKRPGGVNDYNAADVFLDVISSATIYPGTVKIGGNTGKVNTFTGVDLGDLTGGVFDSATLLQGNNLACFAFQAAQAGGIAELKGITGITTAALSAVTSYITAAFADLSCPQLTTLDYSALTKFPGYKKYATVPT